MITLRDWFFSFATVALLGSSSPSGSSFQFTLNPSSIQVGEKAVLEIRIPLLSAGEGALQEVPTVNDELLTKEKKLQTQDRELFTEPGFWVLRYSISSVLPENISIPPVEVRLGSNSYSTERQLLTVETTRAENDTELREDLDPIPPSLPWRLIFKWSVILGLILALGRWIPKKVLRWFRRRNRLEPIPIAVHKGEDPLVWLRNRMQELDRKTVEGSSEDHIMDEWAQIFREYFVRKWKIPARAWTTREMARYLRHDPLAVSLLPIFRDCDQFRFSRGAKVPVIEVVRSWLRQSEERLIQCGR